MKRRTGRTVRIAPPLVLAALVVGFNACSGGGGLVEPVEGCEAYEAAFSACAQKLGPAAQGAAVEHNAMMRASFRAQAKDEASRERVKRECQEAARRIAEVCR